MALNFPNSPNLNDTYTSGGSTWIYDGEVWNIVTSNTPVTISANSFSTIAVAGQSNVVADSTADTLTLTAGSNVTITTDADTDAITISATGGGEGGSASDSFSTIAVSGQNNVVADSATDTLTLVAGTGISITTNSAADSITITNTASAGATTFTGLNDVSLTSLTVDKIYLPAITMLAVTNSGASAYRFDQYGATNNPTLYAINGTTIAFNLQATGHPFLIQNSAGNNYNTGLIHVATDGTVSTAASAQGKDSGTLYWKIPVDISGGYRYQCSVHAPMVGAITIKTFATI
jgi:plastocyanin